MSVLLMRPLTRPRCLLPSHPLLFYVRAMKRSRSFRSQAYKISTRVAAVICVAGALACLGMVALGGVYPESKHGTSIVAPHSGDTWQVGELHTVQWTLDGIRGTNDKGENITAVLMLSYAGTGSEGHVLLSEITDQFPITDRFANVLVPSVPTRNDYALYLFSREDHDVPSWSGLITIFNPNDVDGSDAPPTSLVVTTAPPVSVTRSLTSTFMESAITSQSTSLSLPIAIGNLTSALSLSLPTSLPIALPSGSGTTVSGSGSSINTVTSLGLVSSTHPATATATTLASSSNVSVESQTATNTSQPVHTVSSAASP